MDLKILETTDAIARCGTKKMGEKVDASSHLRLLINMGRYHKCKGNYVHLLLNCNI